MHLSSRFVFDRAIASLHPGWLQMSVRRWPHPRHEMRPKVSKAPLLVFLAVFVTPVVLVPLLANDAQNLKALARRVGFEIDQPSRHLEMQGPNLPPPAVPAPEPTMLDRLTDSRPPFDLVENFATIKPKARCLRLRDIDMSLKPDFKIGADGEWECTALVEGGAEDDSLFLHVRGDHLLMRTFRAKLNLIAGSEQARLVALTASAMGQFLPVDAVYVARTLNAAVDAGEVRNFILGYGEISIRPERSDERRFNVLMRPGSPGDQAERDVDFIIPQRIGPAPAERGVP
jgi:Family of unknown function (DUF6030)